MTLTLSPLDSDPPFRPRLSAPFASRAAGMGVADRCGPALLAPLGFSHASLQQRTKHLVRCTGLHTASLLCELHWPFAPPEQQQRCRSLSTMEPRRAAGWVRLADGIS